MSRPTRDLVTRLQSGEQEAWFEFWDVFGPMIERWVGKLGGRCFTPETVRDIGQETLVRVASEVKKFNPDRGARFSTWLYGVTRCIVQSELKLRNTKKRGSGVRPGSIDFMELDPVGAAITPPEDYERATVRAKVYWAIQKAARQGEFLEFEAFRLQMVESKNGKEISAALGVSEPSTTRLLQRFRLKLQGAIRLVLEEYSFNQREIEESLNSTGVGASDDRLFDEAITHIFLTEIEERQGYETLGQTARVALGG